jgi:hypothetical protein
MKLISRRASLIRGSDHSETQISESVEIQTMREEVIIRLFSRLRVNEAQPHGIKNDQSDWWNHT